MEGIHSIQKHMIKNSYQKHQQRLESIKNNNTSYQFYSTAKPKPQDRKRNLLLKQKHLSIKLENQIMYKKIELIQNRQQKQKSNNIQEKHKKDIMNHHNDQTKQKNNLRYKKNIINQDNQSDQQENNPIEVNSDADEKILKFIVPAPMQKLKNLDYKIKNMKRLNYSFSVAKNDLTTPYQNNFRMKQQKINNQSGSCYQKLHNYKYLIDKHLQNDSNDINQENPQFMVDRVVLYKKTLIPAPMTSCLIQINLIHKRLLFMAYVMGVQNYTAKLYLDETRSQNILNIFKGDYESMGSKVTIDENKQIKIKQLIQLTIQQKSNQWIIQTDIKKANKNQQIKLQRDFIKRNYYIKEQVNSNPIQNAKKNFLQSSSVINQKNRHKSNRQSSNKTQQNKRNSHLLRYRLSELSDKRKSSNLIQEKKKKVDIEFQRKVHKQQISSKSQKIEDKQQNQFKKQFQNEYQNNFDEQDKNNKEQSEQQMYEADEFQNPSIIKSPKQKETENKLNQQFIEQSKNIEKNKAPQEQVNYQQEVNYQEQIKNQQNDQEYGEDFDAVSPKKTEQKLLKK